MYPVNSVKREINYFRWCLKYFVGSNHRPGYDFVSAAAVSSILQGGPKSEPQGFCPYLCQIL